MESLRLVKEAYDNGFTDIILTPHFRPLQGYKCDNQTKESIFDTLKEEVKKNKIDINLYLGNEITIDEDLLYYLDTNMVMSLNKSKYLLIELPFKEELPNLKDYIYDIMEKGYKVIIVHPERYLYYKNLNTFKELIQMGVLFQGNYMSLLGRYGKKAEKTLEEMLKRHMIHFLGSDVHKDYEKRYGYLKELIPRLTELTNSKKMVDDLINNNINKVINNEDIKPYKIKEEDNIFKKLFKR